MAKCVCGAEIDVAGNAECRFCFLRTKLMPIAREWLREKPVYTWSRERLSHWKDTAALRRTVCDYIEELERRLAEKERRHG